MGEYLSENLQTEMKSRDKSSQTKTSVDAEGVMMTPSYQPTASVRMDVGPPNVESIRKSEESSYYESFFSNASGHYKRDPLVAKRGFAVEFPLLCAKHGAALVPEVMVRDPETQEIRALRPLDSSRPRYLGSMADFMPSNVEISIPVVTRAREVDEEGDTEQSLAPKKLVDTRMKETCLPPSPVVLVDFEDLEKQINLKSFMMKGFEADKGIIEALGICFVWYSSLTHVILEKCKLNAKTLKVLARHMFLARTLRVLEIIDNPIAEQNFHVLLEQFTGLENLTLRKCEISDIGAELLARELTYRDPPESHTLQRLNLASNKIGDKGIATLADALRTNRTLKELGLAKNLIGDAGAEALANAAQKFALKSDEILYRNKRSVIRKYLRNKRMKEVQAAEDATSSESTKRKSIKGRRPSKRVKDQVTKEMKYDKHPYVWDARPDGVDLYCVGNITLEKIDLGYNKVSVTGVKNILEAVRYQDYLKKTENRPERGLSAVELEGNPITQEMPEIKRLQEILAAEKREDKTPKHLDQIETKIRRPASKSVFLKKSTASSQFFDTTSKNKQPQGLVGGYYQQQFKEDPYIDEPKTLAMGTGKEEGSKKKIVRGKSISSNINSKRNLDAKKKNPRTKTAI